MLCLAAKLEPKEVLLYISNYSTAQMRPLYECMRMEGIIHTLVNELVGNESPMNKPKMTPQQTQSISLIVSADFKELDLQNMLQELDKLLSWDRQQPHKLGSIFYHKKSRN